MEDGYNHIHHQGQCGHTNDTHDTFKLLDYLHGKVADFTVSENAIESICYDRGLNPSLLTAEQDPRLVKLCYADLLRYVYTQPGITKSYSQTNGTWSQKEGATQLSENDRKRLLAEMNRQYMLGQEPESVIRSTATGIRIEAHGMRAFNRGGKRNHP